MLHGTSEISNYDDIIDSRDVIARIEHLEGLAEYDEDEELISSGLDEDEAAELESLRDLASQGEVDREWRHGVTLIRETYFTDYVKEFAEDTGAVSDCVKWPFNHIDWEAAADELKSDYDTYEFGDVTYYAR
jgi:hypothetical protein